MCSEIALSALTTGIGFAQQRAAADAANEQQRRIAEIQRRRAIAEYDTAQRQYFEQRAAATRQQTEDALKALAARERARTRGGARGLAQSSPSLAQTLAGISAEEGRANQARRDQLDDLSADVADDFNRVYLSGAAASVRNLSDPGPNPLSATAGWVNSNKGDIADAINGVFRSEAS